MRISSSSLLATLAVLALSVSCAHRPSMDSYPRSQYKRNLSFSAQITPISRVNPHTFKGFFLVVKNVQSNPVHILWDRTFYVHKGRPQQGFYIDDLELQNHRRTTDVTTIAPGEVFQTNIWPEYLDHYEDFIMETWEQKPMPPGEHGIYLSVRVDEKEIIKEWLTMSIVETARN